MHRKRRSHPRITIGATVAFLALSGTAWANDEKPVEEPRKKITGEILVGDEESAERSDQQSWLRANIRSKERHGFEYSRDFQVNKRRKLIFSIQGPLIKKKTPGLVFEIKF